MAIAINCRLMRRWEGMEMLETLAYHTVAAVHFTDQNLILKTVYCIKCVMVCKVGFTNWNAKITLLRVSMVVTYYIKLFRTGADIHNGILLSLLLLVAETIKKLLLNVNNLTSASLSKFVQNQHQIFVWGLQLYLKRDSGTGVFLWILQHF